MTSNLDNHKSKYSLIPYIGAAIIGVSIIPFAYTTVKSFISLSNYIQSSNDLRAAGNYIAALDALNTAIKLDSKNPQLYIDRAEVRDKLGDEQGALQDYNKAIELDPKSSIAYTVRAGLRLELWDNQGALQDSNLAIKLAPEFDVAYNNRGLARRYLGDTEGALQDYNKAIQLNAKNATVYYLL